MKINMKVQKVIAKYLRQTTQTSFPLFICSLDDTPTTLQKIARNHTHFAVWHSSLSKIWKLLVWSQSLVETTFLLESITEPNNIWTLKGQKSVKDFKSPDDPTHFANPKTTYNLFQRLHLTRRIRWVFLNLRRIRWVVKMIP